MENNYSMNFLSLPNNTCEDYMVFNLNNNYYAISVQDILEVVNFSICENIQYAPKAIIGLYNYNGKMIKVIDLSPILGFIPEKFSINDKFIILKKNNEIFALHVKNFLNIEKFNKSDFQPFPYETENLIISNIYQKNDNHVSIIDIEKVIQFIDLNKNTGDIDYSSLMPNSEKEIRVLSERTAKNKIKINSINLPISTLNINQYVHFMINNQNYLLDLKYVKQIETTKQFNITKLPYCDDYIAGITNIKGEFIVVVNLNKFLNNDSFLLSEDTKIIVIEGNNFNIALIVDYIKSIVNLKEDEIKTEKSQAEYVLFEFVQNGDLYNILDINKIINDEKLYIDIN